MAKRIRHGVTQDSVVNAIAILDIFGTILPLDMTYSVEELEQLLSPALAP